MEADERDNRVGEGDGDRKPKKRVDRRRNTAMVGGCAEKKLPENCPSLTVETARTEEMPGTDHKHAQGRGDEDSSRLTTAGVVRDRGWRIEGLSGLRRSRRNWSNWRCKVGASSRLDGGRRKRNGTGLP